MYLPEVRSSEFDGWWRKRSVLLLAYEKLIRAGIKDGKFAAADVRTLNELVCALVMSPVFWFRRGKDSAPVAAELVARNVLRLTLSNPNAAAPIAAQTLKRYVDELPTIAPVMRFTVRKRF
jgi:hypothetical protein